MNYNSALYLPDLSLTEARQSMKAKDREIANLDTKETDLQLEVERYVLYK